MVGELSEPCEHHHREAFPEHSKWLHPKSHTLIELNILFVSTKKKGMLYKVGVDAPHSPCCHYHMTYCHCRFRGRIKLDPNTAVFIENKIKLTKILRFLINSKT